MANLVLPSGETVLFDDNDLEFLSQWKWFAVRSGSHVYAICNGRDKRLMHRLLLGVTDRGVWVDHANRNGLDNRRANLRIASPSQNKMNSTRKKNGSSKYKGVVKVRGKWSARICVNGKIKYLGVYPSEHSAALAYDYNAKILFGEFSKLNFPSLDHSQLEEGVGLRGAPIITIKPSKNCFWLGTKVCACAVCQEFEEAMRPKKSA